MNFRRFINGRQIRGSVIGTDQSSGVEIIQIPNRQFGNKVFMGRDVIDINSTLERFRTVIGHDPMHRIERSLASKGRGLSGLKNDFVVRSERINFGRLELRIGPRMRSEYG